jgi:hypothetical protein
MEQFYQQICSPETTSPDVCQERDQLGLGVPGLCRGEAGDGAGKRCKWLIIKPLEPATTV